MLEIYDVCHISISFLIFIVISELWEINPCIFLKCMRNSYGFFIEKMMWYFSSVVLFISFSVILLRCGWGMLHGCGCWGWDV